MNSDFEPPSKSLVLIVSIGGILTALATMAGLNFLSQHIRKSSDTVEKTEVAKTANEIEKLSKKDPIAVKDLKSVVKPGEVIDSQELKTQSITKSQSLGKLTPAEMAIARSAWSYFQTNLNPKTGLVNSVHEFESVTLWDQGAAMAALVSAKELNLITTVEFNRNMKRMLKSLASLPLYNKELPNKVYNSRTLMPVDYGKLDKRQEIGWSAIDLGRMAIWLKIVGSKYPQFKSQTQAVWNAWEVERLTKDGQMYGTSVIENKEQYNQEGRLGYENYAAYGLKLWGLDVKKALDYQEKTAFVNLYGKGIPYDKREYDNSGANNYVLSEPFILDGIELGFKSLSKPYADRILAAQEARYQSTNQLTAVTEDNLDRPPYFVYNSLYVNGQPWATITDTRKVYRNLRFVSTKAAIGWHVLYDSDYTKKLFDFVTTNLKTENGWYNGYYEYLQEPNRSLTANNNGVILQSLLYKKVGQPLIIWAGVEK